MRPVAIGLLVFALTSGGFLAAMLLSAALPQHHLSKDSRETVKLGIGLIATIYGAYEVLHSVSGGVSLARYFSAG